MKKGKLLFEFGVDGGGAAVYLTENGKVVESGSSGGMMDEEEDPHKSWTKEFDSWTAWWADFKNEHKNFWPYFYPLYIDESIKAFIKIEIENFKSADEYSIPDFHSWLHRINSNAF